MLEHTSFTLFTSMAPDGDTSCNCQLNSIMH